MSDDVDECREYARRHCQYMPDGLAKEITVEFAAMQLAVEDIISTGIEYAEVAIRLTREAIAAEIEAHVEEAKQRAWDADYEATSTARDTVAFCAELVRRGEQQ